MRWAMAVICASCRLEAAGLGVENTIDSVAPREVALEIDTAVVDTFVEDTFDTHEATYFLLEDAKSWYDARDACIDQGSHLATITTAAELAVVRALGSGDRWLGLRRDVDAGLFGWITGEPFSLDGFKPGEPNGTGSCAKIVDDGQWLDHSCLESLQAVCERD